MNIGLDTVLQKYGKTLYWLANETGISYANIYRLSKGKTTSVSFDALEKICRALHCTPNDILIID